MDNRTRRVSPALVIACISLFVSLSGFGYAAVKLPRNSVGTPQLRNAAVTAAKLRNGAVTAAKLRNNAVARSKLANNAVSGAKIADGAVTGADVNEGSLGQVPAAATAASATNATNATNASNAINAGNAATVGGLAPSTFARADRFLTGSGDATAATAQTFLTIPGLVRIETDGDGDPTFEIRVFNTSPDTITLSSDFNATATQITPGGFVFVGAIPNEVATWVVRNAAHPERYAAITCGGDELTVKRVECVATLSPAA
jgi:hypothetical protein